MASQVENIKWVPGTDFLVDGFAFQDPRCRHYFLTHFHSDHTVGLHRNFDSGVIYCSHVTARLLVHDKGIKRQYIQPLEVGVPVVICGVRVTPLDANHCPGAVMFLFEVPRVAHAADRGPDMGRPVPVPLLEQKLLGPEKRGKEERKEGTEGSLTEGGRDGATQRRDGRSPNPLEARPLPVVQWPAGSSDTAEASEAIQCCAGGLVGEVVVPVVQGTAAGGGGGTVGDGVVECWSSSGGVASSSHGAAGGGSEKLEDQEGAVWLLPEGFMTRECGDGEDDEVMIVGACEERAGCWVEKQGSYGLWVEEGSEGGCCWQPGRPTHNILHTGDCRWQPWMRHQPGLAGVRVDILFLDTTYAARKHALPPQEEAIRMMVQAMRDALAEEPLTVFLVAAYHIGKERAFLGAAHMLGAKVWVPASKRALLRLLDLPPHLMELLAEAPGEAAVHVTGWGGMQPEHLQAFLQRHLGVWKRAVGIRPTGWTLRRSGGVTLRRHGEVAILGVPYSEHSSWTDLCDAVAALRPRRLVPTVNAATAAQRRALVDLFAPFMDLSADRSRLDPYLAPKPAQPGASLTAGPTRLIGTSTAPHRPLAQGSPPSAATTGVREVPNIKGRDGGPSLAPFVDLAAVDVEEQAHILADLQRQHRRIHQQQHKQRGRGGSQAECHGSNGNSSKGGRATNDAQVTEAQEGGGRPRASGPKRQRQDLAVRGGGTTEKMMVASSGGDAGAVTSRDGKRQRMCDDVDLAQSTRTVPAAAASPAGVLTSCCGAGRAGGLGFGGLEDRAGDRSGVLVSDCWQGPATPGANTSTAALTLAAGFPVIDLTAEEEEEEEEGSVEEGEGYVAGGNKRGSTGYALGPRAQKPVDNPTVMAAVELTSPPCLAGVVAAEVLGCLFAAVAPPLTVRERAGQVMGTEKGPSMELVGRGVGAGGGRRWGQEGRILGGEKGGVEAPLLAQSSIRRFLTPVGRTAVVMV